MTVENTNRSIIGNYRFLCDYKNRYSCPKTMFMNACDIKENAEEKLQEHGLAEAIINFAHLVWIPEDSTSANQCPLYTSNLPSKAPTAPSKAPTDSTNGSISIRFVGWSWFFILVLHVFLQ